MAASHSGDCRRVISRKRPHLMRGGEHRNTLTYRTFQGQRHVFTSHFLNNRRRSRGYGIHPNSPSVGDESLHFQRKRPRTSVQTRYSDSPPEFPAHAHISRNPGKISYKMLKNLEHDTPQNILLKLSSDNAGLESTLEQKTVKLHDDMMLVLLKVFGKMSECDTLRLEMIRVLWWILHSEFLERLIVYLTHVRSKGSDEVELVTRNCQKLLIKLISVLPSSKTKVRMVNCVLPPSSKNDNEVSDLANELEKKLEQVKDETITRKNLQNTKEDDLKPPDNFRDIPVFPQVQDVNGEAGTFLRANVIDRAYRNVDHYLDVQFRLLREDFIRPLREGIAEWHVENGNLSNRKDFRSTNRKVYRNVRIQFRKANKGGVVHQICFNDPTLCRVEWNNTKRLLHGNLVCLSGDDFKDDVTFAVVSERIHGDLTNGIVAIKFLNEKDEENVTEEEDLDVEKPDWGNLPHSNEPQQCQTVDFEKTYTMIESEAYFEAYRHILAGIKEKHDIPLSRYLITCSSDVNPPEYLRGDVEYDISCVMEKGIGGDDISGPFQRLDPVRGEWPTAAELSLNESQAEALKLALTNELAIIQGPPGTGKTHVGLQIMKTLLKNKSKWLHARHLEGNSPILVVCYTNHALDQFLGGIAKFCTDPGSIVRIGGRCKSAELKHCSLHNMRWNSRNSRGNNLAMKQLQLELKSNQRSIEKDFEKNMKIFNTRRNFVIRLSELRPVIHQKLFEQFSMLDDCSNVDKNLLSWLGFDDVPTPEDFRQSIRNIPLETLNELWERRGFSIAEIGRAYHYTGLENAHQLATWMETHPYINDEQQRRDNEDQKLPEEGDGKTHFESAIEQERRFLNTGYRDGFHDTQNIMLHTRVSALSYADINAHEPRYVNNAFREAKQELRKTSVMSAQDEKKVEDIEGLDQQDRWKLYRLWVKRWYGKLQVGSDERVSEYEKVTKRLDDLNIAEDAAILQSADVVAMTTTGAAKYRRLVSQLNTKIVVVEEAAEVLEAHIVTAMPDTTQHLIMIGDHQQLKPSPTVYELAKKFHLDTSLFERMITHGVRHVTLTTQHRMRPEVADLIRPHIYKGLLDHENVLNRRNITGVKKNLFFVSHSIPEEKVSDGKSKKNSHEAEFLVMLCKYLLLQGYQPEQITILTMYAGQVIIFRDLMNDDLYDGVRVTSVDDFQGEENDIILLSLVRSNEEGQIGYLGIENRICVALSRTKNALYCIGNMDLLTSKSATWRQVVAKLRHGENIGEYLELQCKRHPDRITLVQSARDFVNVPEGGCGKNCEARLNCGHVCTLPCHPSDHSRYICDKPCTKKCEYDHRCPKKCHESCGKCKITFQRLGECGHLYTVTCCSREDKSPCTTLVEDRLPCGHFRNIPCHATGDVTLSMCDEKCTDLLECGHQCSGTCHSCSQGRLHIPCSSPCGRILVCGHACKAPCSEYCPPCTVRCQIRCEHSKCPRTCGEPCQLCHEEIEYECGHQQRAMYCTDSCEKLFCDQPCPKKLRCKHKCIGLCGEKCPNLCRVCNKGKVTEIFFGDEDEIDARFIQLEDCGHIFTYQSLDNWMNGRR